MEDLYVDTGGEIPPNAPKTRVKTVQANWFVYSDNAWEKATLQYQTGVIIYCNSSLIIWYYKRQNKVESSTFGA